jgi:hypothetical protein
MKKHLFPCVLILLSIMICSWGLLGHQTVARIAENHLSTNAKQAVSELLGDESLVDVSNWADEVRPTPQFKYTASWHYLNVPPGLNYEEFSGAVIRQQTDNIYSAILQCKYTLISKGSTREQKKEALKFIVHLVGDAHQPMHISRAEDKGGNTIQVQFDGGTNLHALWDSKLIDHQGIGLEEMAKKYDRANSQKMIEWQSDEIMKWLFESYQISSTLYAEIEKGNKLTEDYYNTHIPVVEQRIGQGGIRLAGLLNEVFKYGLTASPQSTDTEKTTISDRQAAATQQFPIQNIDMVMENIGKPVTIIEAVVDYKVLNPNLTLLNIGGKYPNQKLTIAIKGNDIKLNPADLKNKKIKVSGIVELYKDRPEIVVTNPANISIVKS